MLGVGTRTNFACELWRAKVEVYGLFVSGRLGQSTLALQKPAFHGDAKFEPSRIPRFFDLDVSRRSSHSCRLPPKKALCLTSREFSSGSVVANVVLNFILGGAMQVHLSTLPLSSHQWAKLNTE